MSEQLLGRYRLGRVLGTGGMGQVYEAELEGPHGFRKPVALKVLTASEVVDEAIVAEARLGGLVQHPNVVPTLELAHAEGRWYMAMEIVDGPTASALLKHGALPARTALEIGAQTAAGLEYLHTLQVDGETRPLVHRDIKPGNLLIDPAGLVKIVDLGIAGFRPPDQAVGTPGYMPPEQYDGESSPQSDLFALGATLYALLTGDRLLGQGTAAMVRTMLVDERTADPAFAEALSPIDPELPEVLRRCLAREPAQRWESAGALATRLRQLMVRLDGPSLAELVRSRNENLGDDDELTPTLQRTAEVPALPSGPFVGRESELDALSEGLQRSRLALLSGPPGVGKTRLALEYLYGRSGPRCWASLRGLSTGEQLLEAVARSLGLVVPDALTAEWLAEILDLREGLLVVLDQADQLGPKAYAMLEEVIGRSRARWILTARKPRAVMGAHRIEVGPLSESDARALFLLLSGRTVEPKTLAGLVRKLGGLPLSIELAAAGVEQQEPKSLLHDLPTLTDVPTGLGNKAVHDRQVYSTVRWSWDRLSAEERETLVQLAVFQGPFRIEDAQAVVRLPRGRWVMDVLEGLTALRLLVPSGARLALLGSVRELAVRELGRMDDGPLRGRHAVHFSRLGRPESIARLDQPDADAKLSELSSARADLEAAFAYAEERGLHSLAGIAAARLALIAYTGPMLEGLAIVDAALGAAHTPGALTELLRLGFVVAFRAGLPDRARELADLGLEASLSGERRGHFLWMQSVVRRDGTRWEWLDKAEAEAERDGDTLLLAKIANSRSLLARHEGDLDAAQRYEDQALTWASRSGSEGFVSLVLSHRGARRAEAGELDDAADDYLEALAMQGRCRSVTAYVITLLELGALRLRQGQLDDAARMLATGEERVRELGMARFVPVAMYWRGVLAWLNDQADAAVQLWEVGLERAGRMDLQRMEAATLSALANAASVAGRHADARALLAQVPEGAPARERIEALGVRVRAELGAGGDTKPVLAELEALATKSQSPWAEATLWVARARCAAGTEEAADAVARARGIAARLGLTDRSPLVRALDGLADGVG